MCLLYISNYLYLLATLRLIKVTYSKSKILVKKMFFWPYIVDNSK